MNNIFKTFAIIVIASLVLLFYISFNNSQFSNNPLKRQTLVKLKQKEYHIRKLIVQKYSKNINIPVIISSDMGDSLFGLASYDEKNIKIYLNKARFQENEEYMINSVLPHEYAHALMFVFGDFTNVNSGHTLKWEDICRKLEGTKCDRFAKHHDILMGKLQYLY